MAVVEFREVSKHYAPGQPLAVNDLNLRCNEGEMLALLGPSKNGKSSTLKMAAGLEELTSGEILFGDRPISGLAPAKRNIAMVFEDYCLYPNLTIEDNVGFPLSVRRVDGAEQKRRVGGSWRSGAFRHGWRKVDLSGGAAAHCDQPCADPRSDLILFTTASHLDGDQKIHLRAEISRLQRRAG